MHPIIGWVIGILAIVILGVVVDLLLAENKMGKFVKSVFAAAVILVIILPLPSLLNNGCNFDENFIIQNQFELDRNFLEFADRMRMNSLARGVEAQLREDGVSGARVSIEGRVENNDIIVDLVKVDISSANFETIAGQFNPHDLVGRLVSGYLHIDRFRVVVV